MPEYVFCMFRFFRDKIDYPVLWEAGGSQWRLAEMVSGAHLCSFFVECSRQAQRAAPPLNEIENGE